MNICSRPLYRHGILFLASFRHLGIIIIIFHFQAGPEEIRAGVYWDGIVGA